MRDTSTAEARMKAAVIDRLFSGSLVNADSVLVSEMAIANWTRRADIVLANGKLWAFELKSESDSLARLPGQLEAFSYYFERLVVVVAARFERSARAMLTDGVGLWVEEQDGILKERVRSKILPLAKDAAISLMTATELRRLLSCNGVPRLKEAPRQKLESVAMGLPALDLANAARDAVKRRHRSRHLAFVDQRHIVGTMHALGALRRQTTRLPPTQGMAGQSPLPQVEIPLDHPQLLHAPAGPVLRRLVS
jgi:hypothetical protein